MAPEDDLLREYYDIVTKKLEENGFIHYEISNYSKPGYESVHNLTYWRNERYFGVGLGASGYIGDIRYTNTKNLKKYLGGRYRDVEEVVSKKDDINYQIMLNLRTVEGLNLTDFNVKFDIDLYSEKKEEIDELIKNNLLKLENETLSPTYQGMMLLDQILVKLFF